jgi:dipeptidyl aminopeptidase/acylaminoacyl peptidase
MKYSKTRIEYGKHKSEFFDYYLPETVLPDAKLIILIHGGYGKLKYNLTLMDSIAEDLVKRGYPVVNMEYPRVGEGLPCFEMLTSIFRGYDFLETISVLPRIIIGHSFGGYYALMLGMDTRLETLPQKFIVPKTIIALAPLTNLWVAKEKQYSKYEDGSNSVERFIQSETDIILEKKDYEWLSPISYLISCETFLVHGYKDIDVPIEQSVFLYEKRATGSNMHFVDLENVDHFDVINPEHQVWNDIRNRVLIH